MPSCSQEPSSVLAPASWVDLGHSPTAQHVYHVYLNDSVSVVATNCWREEVVKLSSADQEWLAQNCLVLCVTEPLWIAPPAVLVCGGSQHDSNWMCEGGPGSYLCCCAMMFAGAVRGGVDLLLWRRGLEPSGTDVGS